MKKMMSLLILLALLAGSTAQAALILEVNTENKTMTFTGTSSGSFADFGGGFNSAYWTIGDSGAPADTEAVVDVSSAITPAPDFFCEVGLFTSADSAYVNFANSADLNTLSGTDQMINYSSWSGANQAKFEGLIGGTMTLATGSGFGDISIQAVPEPATLGLVGIFGGGIFLARRFLLL